MRRVHAFLLFLGQDYVPFVPVFSSSAERVPQRTASHALRGAGPTRGEKFAVNVNCKTYFRLNLIVFNCLMTQNCVSSLGIPNCKV